MPKKIMIVDDSATARMVIHRCLEIGVSRKAEYIQAVNGKDALEKLKDNPVDLIVTDVNMPEMDGEELVKVLNTTPEYKNIPVIVVSSVANPALKEAVEKHGVSTMISKPLSPSILATAVNKLEIEGLGDSETW